MSTTYNVSAYLGPGTVIRFQGKVYRIAKVNRVNYRITAEDGKEYSLNRNANIEQVDASEFVPNFEKSASVATVDKFKAGQRIVFTGSGKMSGKEGIVFQLNSATCGVVFEGVGCYRIPPALMEPVE